MLRAGESRVQNTLQIFVVQPFAVRHHRSRNSCPTPDQHFAEIFCEIWTESVHAMEKRSVAELLGSAGELGISLQQPFKAMPFPSYPLMTVRPITLDVSCYQLPISFKPLPTNDPRRSAMGTTAFQEMGISVIPFSTRFIDRAILQSLHFLKKRGGRRGTTCGDRLKLLSKRLIKVTSVWLVLVYRGIIDLT